jgi:hypothetical protein
MNKFYHILSEEKCLQIRLPKGKDSLEDFKQIFAGQNFRSMRSTWQPLDFQFARDEHTEKHKWAKPSISNMFSLLAFKAELKESLFPMALKGYELLPFTVEGQPWYAVNCLKTTAAFDEKASDMHRSIPPKKEIFMILKIVFTDPALAEEPYYFTVDGSSRTSLFCGEKFERLVESLSLKGLQFREIGRLAV